VGKVDLRDTEHTWCKGTINIKIEYSERENLSLFSTMKDGKFYNETPSKTLTGLRCTALHERKDFPHYSLKNENFMVCVIINRAVPFDPLAIL
jgi:hypothetical protein